MKNSICIVLGATEGIRMFMLLGVSQENNNCLVLFVVGFVVGY